MAFTRPWGAAPGFDITHVASANPRVSAIAAGTTFIDLLTGKPFTKIGSPGTQMLDIGPSVDFNPASSGSKFAIALPTASSSVTFAVIFRTNGTVAPVIGTLLCTSGTAFGDGIYLDNVHWNYLVNNSGNSTALPTPAVNTPYFYAVSLDGIIGVYRAVLTNLSTGVMYTDTGSIGAPSATNDGFIHVGSEDGSWLSQGYIAAAMHSAAALPMSALQQWAADPWSFWFPNPDNSLVGVVANAIAMLARAAGMSTSRSTTAGKAPLAGKATAQAKLTASGVYKMAFSAKAASASTARSSNLVTTLFFQALAATKATLKSTGSYKAALSGLIATQAKATASGVYKMAFGATAATASHFKGLLSNGAQLAGAGSAVAQAKLKAGMSLSAALAGKAVAQAKVQAGGIFTMAFTAKSQTQSKARTSTAALLLFMVANSVSQAKARTGNTLRVLMSAASRASSRFRGAMSGGSNLVRSKFYAYFIS